MKICKQFTLVLVDITSTINTKLYNGMIRWEARSAVKEARHTRETVNTMRDVCRFMYHTDNLKDKLNFSRSRKEIIQASLEKANKWIAALKSRVDIILKAKLKSKSNNNNNNNKVFGKRLQTTIEIATSDKPNNLEPSYFLSAHPELQAAASTQP